MARMRSALVIDTMLLHISGLHLHMYCGDPQLQQSPSCSNLHFIPLPPILRRLWHLQFHTSGFLCKAHQVPVHVCSTFSYSSCHSSFTSYKYSPPHCSAMAFASPWKVFDLFFCLSFPPCINHVPDSWHPHLGFTIFVGFNKGSPFNHNLVFFCTGCPNIHGCTSCEYGGIL